MFMTEKTERSTLHHLAASEVMNLLTSHVLWASAPAYRNEMKVVTEMLLNELAKSSTTV